MKPVVIVVAVGATLAGLVSAGPAVGSPQHRSSAAAHAQPAAAGSITWGACPAADGDIGKGSGVQCAGLKVPLDYSKPHGKQITIEVSEVKNQTTTADYQGVILTNPGGPGGAGLDLGYYLAPAVPDKVGQLYDWISWDPRGVGTSKPALSCDTHYFDPDRKSYVPTTKKIEEYWLTRSKRYAEACEKKHPALLEHMTTIDNAKDMESIRKALGVSQISYYGYSYGTYLGQVYSTRYPFHLKRMVLDSNVDPRRVWYPANLDQDKAFDRNIDIYFTWVAKHHDVYHLGKSEKSVRALYYATLAQLTRVPDGHLGPDEWVDAFLGAGYYRFGWEDLAAAWNAYDKKGDSSGIIQQYQGSDGPGDDNEFAVYNATQCTDTQWPTKFATWKKDNDAIYAKHPFETWSNVWFNSPCLYWGAKAHKPQKIDGSLTKSALLIDETLDAATPYPGSLEVRKLYPNSTLLAEPGGTNHAYSLSGDDCVDDVVSHYLATGEHPSRKDWNGPDYLCKPLPQPDPTEASSDLAGTTHTQHRPFVSPYRLG